MSSIKVGARCTGVSVVATSLAYMLMRAEIDESNHLSKIMDKHGAINRFQVSNWANSIYNCYLPRLHGNMMNCCWTSNQLWPYCSTLFVTNCETNGIWSNNHLGASTSKESMTNQTNSSIKTDHPLLLPPTITRSQRILQYCGFIRELHTPRLLTASDPVFDYPQMKKGLKQRIRDERALRNLQTEAIEARKSQNPERIQAVFMKISNIAYGMSPQDREEFLMRYGCSAWTEEILSFIVGLSKDRGIVEIGAGNGQWARAIHDRVKKIDQNSTKTNTPMRNYDDFILAFDNMKELPLSPKIYHSHTQPAHDYFYNKVQSCSSHIDAARRMSSRGRVLLLVYPPPGPMAVETVKAYTDVYPQGNDTVVYVGEGRGGANGNDELFNYFCNSGEWILTKVLDVQKSIKGYERCFCFQRVIKSD